MLRDISEANRIRVSAERLDIRGDHATAILFRNAAWKLEQGREWLDDVSVRETTQVPERTTYVVNTLLDSLERGVSIAVRETTRRKVSR